MSDTDDTDLLLLIPPDFFLVRSDLEDFDSDIDIESQELKDTIVSDLITQVNDLESRICQIESLERTSTRCSTCNDDSFINQSIISLTEPDVLRAYTKEQGFFRKRLTDTSLMVKSPDNDIPPGLTCHRADGDLELSKGLGRISEDNLVNRTIDGDSYEKLNSPHGQKTEIKGNTVTLESQLSREKQTQLLNEVDSFLLNKQLNTSEFTQLPLVNNLEEVCHGDQKVKIPNNDTLTNQSPRSLKENFALEIDEQEQSLALTEVYKLISEMEETQTEMQKKLNISSSKQPSPLLSRDDVGINRNIKSLGKALDVEDLTTKSPKPLYGGGINRNVENLDAYRSSQITETNYAFTQFPLSTEEKSNQVTSKPLSPNRVGIKNYDPFEIVRANLPGKQDARSSQFGDDKSSPRKSAGFRRQLQFEKAFSPLRASKSRPSLIGEQRSYNINENQSKSENDRFIAPTFKNSRSVKTDHSLEDKFNSLTVQRATHKESSNSQPNFTNKPASDTLHQKISSNNLLSLSELWNKEPSFYSDDPNKLRQKLEEERYRRQHCEQQIQTLQLRVLEEQERLAVAVRVDGEKDRAIAQITEAESVSCSVGVGSTVSSRYRRYSCGEKDRAIAQITEAESVSCSVGGGSTHCEQQIQTLQLRVLEEQERLAVAVRVDGEKDRAIAQITEAWRRLTEHWGELEQQRHSLAEQLQAEREAARTRDDELTKKVERWEKEVSQALDLAAGYKEKCESVQKQMELLKKDSSEKLQDLENQLSSKTEENQKLTEENSTMKEQIKLLQEQLKEEEDLLSKLKTEVEKSRKRLDEFEAENCVLKEQKSSLTTSIKEERNRISILEQKLNTLQQSLNEAYKKEKAAAEEVRKSQERVEVARTELRALYQGQLEAVVKEKLQEFQAQLEAAEAALRTELQTKEKQWAEKANDQYRQLYDKYKRDLARVEQIHKGDVNSWREKLVESERQRAALEQRLREEADARTDIAQRLHSVMEAQWREALKIISNPVKALYEIPKQEEQRGWPQQGEGEVVGVRASRSESTASLGGEELPFGQEGMVTYRTPQAGQDLQLKKYIQMLLERGPGNPVPPTGATLPDSPEREAMTAASCELLDRWIKENEKKTGDPSDRQNQLNKPPWR